MRASRRPKRKKEPEMCDAHENTVATATVDDLMTVAILLAVNAVDNVRGKARPGSKFVRFEVDVLVEREEFDRLEALCFEGGYGVTVDAGVLNQNFRDVRAIMDRALQCR
jgi:hypothetical protein